MDDTIRLLVTDKRSAITFTRSRLSSSGQKNLDRVYEDEGWSADSETVENKTPGARKQRWLSAVVNDLAARDVTARTAGTTRGQLLRLAQVPKDEQNFHDDWHAAAVTIFEAYMTGGQRALATPAEGVGKIDGVPLLRARMLVWSQHADPKIADALRIERGTLQTYVNLWVRALKHYDRKAAHPATMVRLLAGLLDGVVLDVSVQEAHPASPATIDKWGQAVATAGLAIIEAFTVQL